MHRLLLAAPTLSYVLLAAHELRRGDLVHLAGWAAAAVLLNTLRREWVRRVCLLGLCLGLLVWTQTAVDLVRFRVLADQPYTLLIAIMGGAAALMGGSILILFSRRMREWFGAEETGAEDRE
jgi:hypothetical protein